MLDKRSQAVSSIALATSCSSTHEVGNMKRVRPLRSAAVPVDPAADQPKDLNADYSEEKIYLPSFATEQAMSGQYEYARQLYDTWIDAKCEPDDYRIFFNRAICNYELDAFEQALDDVNVVIRLKDKWPKGECTLCLMLLSVGSKYQQNPLLVYLSFLTQTLSFFPSFISGAAGCSRKCHAINNRQQTKMPKQKDTT